MKRGLASAAAVAALLVGVVAGLLATTSIAALAGTESMADGLRRCARESDEHRRLDCFDALARTVPAMKTDQFGMTAEIAHKRQLAAPYRPQEAEVLAGKIAALRQASHGEWIFTLDNQQTWIEAQAQDRIRFKVGEAVHIEYGAMGSLWLAADKGRKTKVKRIR